MTTDQRSWLWKKKSSEKTIVVPDKVDLSSRPIDHEEEIHVLLAENAELQRDLRDLSDKLSSAVDECNAKDDLVKKNAKTAQEALAGWEKAEAKVLLLKQELDAALEQRETSEERTSYLDHALKECMQQLRFVREDQEKRIHDVLLKASEELEETKMFLEEKLAESGKKISELTAENSQLSKALFLKDQQIEDLDRQTTKAEAYVKALLARLEAMEKDNNSLRYEVRLLEKEVDVRNEEREFNRVAADATHKKHLENVKKIAKLESECQRLRVLVRKRLPGPAALAKMKSEVDVLERDSAVVHGRKKSNLSPSKKQFDYVVDGYPESPGKKIDLLTETICALEEENNSLRETLQKKTNELQVSRNMYVRTASKLSQIDGQFEESSNGQNQMIDDIRRISTISHDLSLGSMSDVGSDDKVSCAGSWASALISELDHFRDGKDKLALTLTPSKSVGISDVNHLMDDFDEMEKLALVRMDKPIENSSIAKYENYSNSPSRTTGKELVPVPSRVDANDTRLDSNVPLPSKLSTSISKLIEIIEGINLASQDYDALQTLSVKNGSYLTQKNLETSTGYMVRVFQWRTSELAIIVQKFLCTCHDLLTRRADFEMFTQELTTAFEWVISHCFSLQDVSSMKDVIKKEYNLYDTRSESETEMGTFDHFSEAHCDAGKGGGKWEDLVRNMDSEKKELEEKFRSAGEDCENLRNELQKSQSTVGSLRAELEALKHTKAVVEDHFENRNMTIEDLNLQLLAVRSELDGAQCKLVALEVQLKNKVDHSEELEAKCRDLQLQLERVKKMDTAEHVGQDKNQLRTEWEISAASEKLAECQETILHLGKQLRAMTMPQDTSVSQKFISTPTNHNNAVTTTTIATTTTTALATEKKLTSQRSSLLDQMQAEDNQEAEQLESPKTKEIICAKGHTTGNDVINDINEIITASLAIVPSKKHHTTSGGLLKKLFWRKRKGGSKKMSLPFAT